MIVQRQETPTKRPARQTSGATTATTAKPTKTSTTKTTTTTTTRHYDCTKAGNANEAECRTLRSNRPRVRRPVRKENDKDIGYDNGLYQVVQSDAHDLSRELLVDGSKNQVRLLRSRQLPNHGVPIPQQEEAASREQQRQRGNRAVQG